MNYSLVNSEIIDVNGVEVIQKDFLIENPTSNAMLDVSIYYSKGEILPVAILIPGGLGSKEDFTEKKSYGGFNAPEYGASLGNMIIVFSPDGRGKSEGEENYNGYIAQDGLYEIYKFVKNLDNIDQDNIGFISYSFGVAMASGVLGRYEVPVKYYIEWEGPVDRNYVTVGCEEAEIDILWTKQNPCIDDEFWNEREAINYVSNFDVEYFQIIQNEEDHVQSSSSHSIDMNNEAIKYLDWVRVNNGEINVEYNLETISYIEEEYDIVEKSFEYLDEFSS